MPMVIWSEDRRTLDVNGQEVSMDELATHFNVPLADEVFESMQDLLYCDRAFIEGERHPANFKDEPRAATAGGTFCKPHGGSHEDSIKKTLARAGTHSSGNAMIQALTAARSGDTRRRSK
jgi:hypothetical protein